MHGWRIPTAEYTISVFHLHHHYHHSPFLLTVTVFTFILLRLGHYQTIEWENTLQQSTPTLISLMIWEKTFIHPLQVPGGERLHSKTDINFLVKLEQNIFFDTHPPMAQPVKLQLQIMNVIFSLSLLLISLHDPWSSFSSVTIIIHYLHPWWQCNAETIYLYSRHKYFYW
jgi:hypothetical protein